MKIQKTYDSPGMAERRRRILHETRKLINEEGLEGFSIRELSRRANVAPKTLYNAYGDRDRLIGVAIREVYDAVRQNVKFKTSDRTLPGLLDRAMMLNRGNLKARNYAKAVATIYFAPGTGADLRQILQEMAVGNTREWLEDLRDVGQLQNWVDVEHLTRNMANMEYGLIMDWATSRVEDAEYLFRFAEIVLLSAMAATRGEVYETARAMMTRMAETGKVPAFENPVIRNLAYSGFSRGS
ncbi:TetR/AcrR family transcriptional regulator [Sphingomonas sp. ID1715]|uniref:TetR/AcrR family transcriptional regulator n=1 Tax=Sphingomonas sp. ID1715 TaxID=1656898 RepID=UPI0014893739|nr:TetR/AcrR family transcriptional regulator [Sphingomonas sp. ID1715]NNM78085.1 TetR/AcrR family transcriptional regulator [Sphingomonas sp. ID1715]